jgi:hypothetical protein
MEDSSGRTTVQASGLARLLRKFFRGLDYARFSQLRKKLCPRAVQPLKAQVAAEPAFEQATGP